MAVINSLLAAFAVMYPLLGASVVAGSIADIEHVVLFMQENRAFDHYFGSMAGVRGFSDPNVQVNPRNVPVWQQEVNSALTTNASYLLPWYINYQGGDFPEATQCMVAGSNGWQANHAALNSGLNNQWATNNTPFSWGHYRREDIPVQYSIADAWTIGDMYQEAVIASTDPNRVTWTTGSVNVPGGPQKPSEGGNPFIDNNETPGCETGGFNCYPLSWKTAAEYYQDAGVSWSIFQDADNFDDNPLAWFSQFQDALNDTQLYQRGMVGSSLDTFYARAANGTLPAISIIIGPGELSEHPPHAPRDGAWLQKKIVDAVTQGKGYAKTALMISYDETGGWGDHVTPYHSPEGTPGEWINDPYELAGYTYSGPGYRLPFYIISPWTRGGSVFTEHADHNSQLLFIEEWLKAKGKDVTTSEMGPWRREHMSSLVNAFDFDHPDYSLPNLPAAPAPHVNSAGQYDGASYCASIYSVVQPDVPYTSQVAPNKVSSFSEQGFKPVRGALTEGRYLTFEADGYALTNSGKFALTLSTTKATSSHNDIRQRWVVHTKVIGGNEFTISSAVDGRYIGLLGFFVNNVKEADTFTVTYSATKGYALKDGVGKYVAVDKYGRVQLSGAPSYFNAFSVTYSS